MSYIPNNPLSIVRYFTCASTAGAASGGREGVEIWQGRCAGFLVQSWPAVNQVLEIIDTETDNTMTVIPVPGRPILFGTIKSVILRTSFKVALLVDWRIVLQAFIDPVYALLSQGVHGHSQWIDVVRNQSVANQEDYDFEFYAWADGILRYLFRGTGGNWIAKLYVICESAGPAGLYEIVHNHALSSGWEKDIIEAGITNGRHYLLRISHDDIGTQQFGMDVGILDAPIAQA